MINTISDKITPDIKLKFLEALNKTKQTGNEHGFYLCTDDKGNLSPSKLRSGERDRVEIGNPTQACKRKEVQGDFHTHTYFTIFKKTSRFMKPGMSDNDIKKFINNEFDKYKKDLDIKEISIDSPSSKDLLKSLLYRCVGISRGVTCTGSDFGNDKIECWTTNKISPEICSKTYLKLFENEKEKDLVQYDKETISLFDKEVINL